MKFIRNISKAFAAGLTLTMVSCNGDWLDINTDPNNPVEPDLELLIPSMQGGLVNALVDRYDHLAPLGHNAEAGISRYTLTSDGGFDLGFEEIYVDALINAERVINDAPNQDPPLPAYAGIAKLIKAYSFGFLIDMYGTVPYDEALLGAEGPLSPQYEDGAQVYDKVLGLIDSGLADLAEGGVTPANDIIYQGDIDRWIKFGNTLKMKLLLNLRLVDASRARTEINTLLASGNLMSDNGDDADFFFGSGITPQNRHRLHQTHYQGAKTFYMSNYMMHTMYNKYENVDPRMRFYFYRQIGQFDPTSPKLVEDDFPCFGYGAVYEDESTWTTTCPYGYVGDGYIGRDHGDNAGIPNDGGSRTTYGIYPIGGLFDDDGFKTVTQSDGTGAGFYPLLSHFMAKFMEAEAQLTLNNDAAAARLALEAGMTASISKVLSYGAANASNFDSDLAPSQDDVDAFIDEILATYDAASSDEDRLNVIMEQWQIANFGNNSESWINLRRTKLPLIEPAVNASGRMSIVPSNTYPRRLPFAASEISTNTTLPDANEVLFFQTPIFWDATPYPARF